MRETIETPYAIQGFFGKYRPLSNFDTTPFIVDGVKFKSGEHALHYYKTDDAEWQNSILNANTPSEAKKLGRRCPMRGNWDETKAEIIKRVLIFKFTQNSNIRDLLLSTGYKYLEETNDWNDTFWGVCNGKGRNELGKALMFVRSKLIIEEHFKFCENIIGAEIQKWGTETHET